MGVAAGNGKQALTRLLGWQRASVPTTCAHPPAVHVKGAQRPRCRRANYRPTAGLLPPPAAGQPGDPAAQLLALYGEVRSVLSAAAPAGATSTQLEAVFAMAISEYTYCRWVMWVMDGCVGGTGLQCRGGHRGMGWRQGFVGLCIYCSLCLLEGNGRLAIPPFFVQSSCSVRDGAMQLWGAQRVLAQSSASLTTDLVTRSTRACS